VGDADLRWKRWRRRIIGGRCCNHMRGRRCRFQSEDPACALGCNQRWRHDKLGGGVKHHRFESKAASYRTSAGAISETGSGATDCNPRQGSPDLRIGGCDRPRGWWVQIWGRGDVDSNCGMRSGWDPIQRLGAQGQTDTVQQTRVQPPHKIHLDAE
jgi:hypothetical protein